MFLVKYGLTQTRIMQIRLVTPPCVTGTGILTIGPGVKVIFKAGAAYAMNLSIRNGGALVAIGTESQPIIFTSDSPTPAPADWYGIQFVQDQAPVQGSTMAYCDVQYAGNTGAGSGGVGFSTNTNAISIDHCTFSNNQFADVAVRFSSNITFTDCQFASPCYGVHISDKQYFPDLGISFIRCKFNYNQTGILWATSKGTIRSCEFTGCNYGVYLWTENLQNQSNDAPPISSCTFRNCTSIGISCDALYAGSVITDCEIRSCANGITIGNRGEQQSGLPDMVRNCIIMDNEIGVSVVHTSSDESLRPDFGTSADLGSNTISNNTQWNYYNNTTRSLYALGNNWGLINHDAIDATIHDDNESAYPGQYGEVYFDLFKTPLWSDLYGATAYGNGCKLVCVPSAGQLHIAFQRIGKVCYSRSDDYGVTWADAIELSDPGFAATPAIARMNWPSSPCIVYNSALSDGSQLLQFTKNLGTGWENPTTIPGVSLPGTGLIFFRSPAAIMTKRGASSGADTIEVVVEETLGSRIVGTDWSLRYIKFLANNPGNPVVDATLQTAHFPPEPWVPHSPSVARDIQKRGHIVYSLAGGVHHLAQNTDGSWTAPELISFPGTNANEGYIECFSDSAAVVWTVQENTSKDVWRRTKKIGIDWRTRIPVSQTPNQESEHPVSAYGYTFWAENDNNSNYETYYQKKDGSILDISNTPLTASVYAASCFDRENLYAAWTETNGDPNSPMEPCISNIAVTSMSLGGGIQPVYAVGVGGAEASSYNLQRDGYYLYPSGIAVDYSTTELVYDLPYLDASQDYSLQVVGYHESSGKWNMQVNWTAGKRRC